MKENFLDLAKEIDIEVQKSQRVPIKLDPKRTTPKHNIIKMPKFKDKGRILKAAKERRVLPTKEFPLEYQLISQKKPCGKEGARKKYSKL